MSAELRSSPGFLSKLMTDLNPVRGKDSSHSHLSLTLEMAEGGPNSPWAIKEVAAVLLRGREAARAVADDRAGQPLGQFSRHFQWNGRGAARRREVVQTRADAQRLGAATAWRLVHQCAAGLQQQQHSSETHC